MKPSKQSQSNSQRPVEGLAIPSIGPFVNGSDGNLQEVMTNAHTTPRLSAAVLPSGCCLPFLCTKAADCLPESTACVTHWVLNPSHHAQEELEAVAGVVCVQGLHRD